MRCDRLFIDLVDRLAAALFLVAIMANAATGQGGPPGGLGMPGNNNPKIATQEREIREGRLRSAELNTTAENTNQQRIEATLAKMKEDFTRIQILRNQIARSLLAKTPIEYRLVSQQAEEINKRSNRLKMYMVPRATGDKENDKRNLAILGSGDMTSALVQLCKLIDGFVENPALKNAATIDAQRLDKTKMDKAKADRDLLSIIELSNRIQKSVAKLVGQNTSP